MNTVYLSTGSENFVTGLGVTVSGLIIVFIVLILICAILNLSGYIFAQKEKKQAAAKAAAAPAAAPEPVAEVVEEADDGELVAVITAAVAAYRAATEGVGSTGSFTVRSFKRVGRNKRA